jgi:lipopolysaccharide export LptBFGC system permease protein LptF
MKILDKYIAKNFLTGYAIAFGVLIGLRIVIELFVNLDEFTEKTGTGTADIIRNILVFYGLRSTLYFRDFAGMITVMAAAFSFGKMVRSGELIAVMASGISLKRVIVPVIILALLSTALFIIDQEFIIPPLADRLVRGEDELAGKEFYDVKFLNDAQGSLLFSPRYDIKTETLNNPTILLRKRTQRTGIWEVTGWLSAQQAEFNPATGRWDLLNGLYMDKKSQRGPVPIISYLSDITPRDIPIRRQAAYKSLLSWTQLRNLAQQGSKIKDLAQLCAQMQSHITDPLINLVMLLISLPILICRDPKSMKSAIIISFAATSLCFVITFICKLFATEVFFDRIIPEFWVWLPVFIFLPVAIIELDSMKT